MNLSAGSPTRTALASHLVLNRVRLCVKRAPRIQCSVWQHAPPFGAWRSRLLNIRRIGGADISSISLIDTGCELFNALSSKLDCLKKA
jgi:hypothetical protein